MVEECVQDLAYSLFALFFFISAIVVLRIWKCLPDRGKRVHAAYDAPPGEQQADGKQFVKFLIASSCIQAQQPAALA